MENGLEKKQTLGDRIRQRKAKKASLQETQSPENQPSEYSETKEINGVKLSVGWDEVERCYTLLLPQLELSDNPAEQKPEECLHSNRIRIDVTELNARKALDFASKLAAEGKNPEKIYRETDAYIDSLDLKFTK